MYVHLTTTKALMSRSGCWIQCPRIIQLSYIAFGGELASVLLVWRLSLYSFLLLANQRSLQQSDLDLTMNGCHHAVRIHGFCSTSHLSTPTLRLPILILIHTAVTSLPISLKLCSRSFISWTARLSHLFATRKISMQSLRSQEKCYARHETVHYNRHRWQGGAHLASSTAYV